MIGRLSLIAGAGAAAVSLTSTLAAPAAGDANRLFIRTGPGLEITLTRAGREVDYLRPGRHTIRIRDTSRIHSVQLLEPARKYNNILSTLAFVGTKTVTVMLQPGVYNLYCKRHHQAGMRDLFRVQ